MKKVVSFNIRRRKSQSFLTFLLSLNVGTVCSPADSQAVFHFFPGTTKNGRSDSLLQRKFSVAGDVNQGFSLHMFCFSYTPVHKIQ